MCSHRFFQMLDHQADVPFQDLPYFTDRTVVVIRQLACFAWRLAVPDMKFKTKLEFPVRNIFFSEVKRTGPEFVQPRDELEQCIDHLHRSIRTKIFRSVTD